MANDINKVIEELRKFNNERNWTQFHDGKNLALALMIESSELNECFLWKESKDVNVDKLKEELADVFNYAFMLADKYDLDIEAICLDKIVQNGKKYPVEKSKGKSNKYTEL